MTTWEKNRNFHFQTNLKPSHANATPRNGGRRRPRAKKSTRTMQRKGISPKKKKRIRIQPWKNAGSSPTPFLESGGRTWIRQNTATAAYSVKPCMATKKRNEEEKNGIQKAGSNAWTKNAKSVRCRPSRCHPPRGSRGRIRGSVPWSVPPRGTRAVARERKVTLGF